MLLLDDFQNAFNFYNSQLFNNSLPNCVFTLTRKARTKGYFSPKRYIDNSKDYKHEIAINPTYLVSTTDIQVLSTFVHELCHMYMEEVGKAGKRGYHNKAWASLMESIGLIPSSTGGPGGKKTGYSMTHYIDENGRFFQITNDFINNGFKFDLIDSSSNEIKKEDEKVVNSSSSKNGKRIKYKCLCSQVWGKSNLQLICGQCNHKLTPIV